MKSADSRAEFIRQFYGARLRENRSEHYDILDWSSQESQFARFAELAKIINENFAADAVVKILDVGCGLADLALYLAKQKISRRGKIVYSGIDLNADLIAVAQRENPQCDLRVGDIFIDDEIFAPQSFDVIFCSGIFNLKLGNNEDFAKRALKRLQKFSANLLVANFLHKRAENRYAECFYFDPEKLRAAIAADQPAATDWQFTIRDKYLPNDFTLIGKFAPAKIS